jgi:hypothetical protein
MSTALLKQRILKSDFNCLLYTALDAIEPNSLINRIVKIVKNEANEKVYMQIPSKYLFKNQNVSAYDDYQQYELKRNVYVASFGKAALGKF